MPEVATRMITRRTVPSVSDRFGRPKLPSRQPSPFVRQAMGRDNRSISAALPLGAPDSRAGAAVIRRFDELKVIRLDGISGHVVTAAERDTAAAFVVIYAVHGDAHVEHRGAVDRLGAGDLVVLAGGADVHIDCFGDSVVLVVDIPSGAMGPWESELRVAAGVVRATDGGTPQLAARLLDGLADDLVALAPAQPGRLARHLVGFLAMACEDGCAASSAGPDTAGHPHVAKAKEYIESHLVELDLSPIRVARALNMSVRSLHRVFESESLSVAGWIRWRRLEHCRSELADRANDHEAVSVIGARWGFWDAAHFSKAFKAQYDISPRLYRSRASQVESVCAATA